MAENLFYVQEVTELIFPKGDLQCEATLLTPPRSWEIRHEWTGKQVSPESHAYAGNLLHNLEVWRRITSDPWVLETVSGYHLEFNTLPVQSVLPRPPPFSEREKQLIDEEITKLLTKGAIRKVYSCPYEFISNIFLVPKKTGDLRPVINLKPLNQFVQRIHFKMENIPDGYEFCFPWGLYGVTWSQGRLFQCANFLAALQIFAFYLERPEKWVYLSTFWL